MKKLVQQLMLHYFESIYLAMRNERRVKQEFLVELDSTATLLGCGCREGDNTFTLAQKISARQVIGLDYNFEALCLAKKRNIYPLQSNLNYQIPLTDNSIDTIIASDVLEHLVNPQIFVMEMYRVLKPGGYILLDTPNLASWHNIFALLIGVQPFSGPNITTMEDSDLELVRRMHRSTHGLPEDEEYKEHGEKELTRHIVVVAYISLIRLLGKTGFKIEKAFGFGYYPLPVFLARLFQQIDIRHAHHILIKARKPGNK
jgi:ubiquinone/menaquinone biosynthesis C-methylase UbiE